MLATWRGAGDGCFAAEFDQVADKFYGGKITNTRCEAEEGQVPDDDDDDVEHGIFPDDLQGDSARCGGRIPPRRQVEDNDGTRWSGGRFGRNVGSRNRRGLQLERRSITPRSLFHNTSQRYFYTFCSKFSFERALQLTHHR